MFEGARQKIKRAEKHIDELESAINAFSQTDYCDISPQVDPQSGLHTLRAEIVGHLPEEIALIIGDAIHNLRTSLDHMFYELVEYVGGTPDPFTKFPFRTQRQELVAALNGGGIRAAPSTITDLITNTIKPYRGGNDALYGLHDLDIGDKHQLLIPLVSVAEILSNFDLRRGGVTIMSFEDSTIQVTSTGYMTPVAMEQAFELVGDFQPTLEVIFSEATPFKRQAVLPTLHQLSQLVYSIVQSIEEVCLAQE